jgi:hypothetical protein
MEIKRGLNVSNVDCRKEKPPPNNDHRNPPAADLAEKRLTHYQQDW